MSETIPPIPKSHRHTHPLNARKEDQRRAKGSCSQVGGGPFQCAVLGQGFAHWHGRGSCSLLLQQCCLAKSPCQGLAPVSFPVPTREHSWGCKESCPVAVGLRFPAAPGKPLVPSRGSCQAAATISSSSSPSATLGALQPLTAALGKAAPPAGLWWLLKTCQKIRSPIPFR